MRHERATKRALALRGDARYRRPVTGSESAASPRLPLVALVLALVALTALAPSPASAASSYTLEARYDVRLHLDWDSRWVDVRTRIDVRNTAGRPIDRLELNSTAVKLGPYRRLRARVDGAAVRPRVSGQTIIVPFAEPLAAGASVVVFVGLKSRLAQRAGGRSYYWAKLGGVVQMYRFIPWVSRRIPFGRGGHGEPFLTPVSPRVQVTVSADRKLQWATSGRLAARIDARTFRFVAERVRDFNIAASPAWRKASGRSRDGRTHIIALARVHDPVLLVRLARTELARYQSQTGVRYRHKTFTVAETGGGLAMESPALIWMPASRSSRDLSYLVSHETAHQWWYSTVGNDQSTDAFADEAMADYFSRKARLSIRQSRCPNDRLDREIRDYSEGCYFEVIYVQGARFLDKLRRDFGQARFMAAVRRYTRDNRDGLGGNVRLLEAMRAEMGDGVVARFHRRFPSLY